MQNESTHAIVLSRTNYGEADKIITSITATGKKVSLIAKGVRKPKSKLAAGTELFCVSDITYVQGKGKMATLTGARIVSQHTSFLNDLEKVTLAYDIIKIINKHTEETDSAQYFILLQQLFAALDDGDVNGQVLRLWAWMQILEASGHRLQLEQQTDGCAYQEDCLYGFDGENGGFIASSNGRFTAHHIKFSQLAQNNHVTVLGRVQHSETYAQELIPVFKYFIESTY